MFVVKDSNEVSNYKGSQAHNKTNYSVFQSVNSATGGLAVSIPLLTVKSYIPIELQVIFSSGSLGNFGLPNGWQFNIDYVIPRKSITFNGQTYIIDPNWVDSSGYKSGLRYLNQHGVLFETLLVNKKLPKWIKDTREYRSTLSMPDGSVAFFDATGKLLAKCDRFKNYILYYYIEPLAGVQNNRLKSISDCIGQTFNFSYESNKITIRYSDYFNVTYTKLLSFNSTGIQSYTDAMNFVTSFTYQTRNNVNVIASIKYPNGLESNITYQNLPYVKSSGGQGNVNAVKTIDNFDLSLNKSINSVTYTFSNTNYTGYPTYPLSKTKDSLLESNSDSFRYSVTITTQASSSSNDPALQVRKRRIIYNSMSEEVECDSYLLNHGNPIYKIVNSYSLIPNKHARTVNYNKPNKTVHLVYNKTKYTTITKKLMTYDDFGNTTTVNFYKYNPLSKKLILEKCLMCTYDTAHYNLLLMHTISFLNPLTSQMERHCIKNELSETFITIKNSVTYNREEKPWKSEQYTYDSHGFKTSKILSWCGEGNPGIQSSTERYACTYKLSKNTLSHTDPLGNISTKVINAVTNCTIEITLPLGNTTKINYDKNGRVLSRIFPLGNKIEYSYQDYQTSATKNNSITKTLPLGFKRQTQYSATGHKIALYSNTNPENPEELILHDKWTYNEFGEVIQKQDVFGNVTLYGYNALGLMTSKTDLDKNEVSIVYDYPNLSESYSVNGIKDRTVVRDTDKKTIKTTFFPNTYNTVQPKKYNIEYDSLFNGIGFLIQVQKNQIIKENTNILYKKTMSYSPDGKVTMQELEVGKSKTVINTQYDILNNVLSQIKNTYFTDSKGKHNYKIQRDTFQYDVAGNIIAIVDNTKKTVKKYTYDKNNNVSLEVISPDINSVSITYKYDQNNNLITKRYKKANNQHAIEYQYNQDGAITELSLDKQNINIAYTLSGQEKSYTYPDGKSRSIVYDKYCNITQITDVNSQTTHYNYLKNGKVNNIIMNNGHSVNYIYSTIKNPSSNKEYGVIVEKDYKQYSEKISYDAFHRPSNFVVSDNEEELLKIERDFNCNGLIVKEVSSSELSPQDPNVNYTKNYSYDDYQRLVSLENKTSYSQISSKYIYDGNNNILSKSDNDQTTSYKYNEFDQLTSYTDPNEKTYHPKYDTYGNQVYDGKTYHYQYNILNQIIKATVNGIIINYSYYADGLRQNRISSSDKYSLYYNSHNMISAINNITSKSKTSFFIDNDKRICAFNLNSNQPALYYINNGKSNKITFNNSNIKDNRDIKIIGTTDYEPYGQHKNTLGTDISNNFTYNCEYQDPTTNLVYLKSRDYCPEIQRFMSMDTYNVWNKYNFADANPIMFVDPSGHSSILNYILNGLAVIGGIIAIATSEGAAAPIIGGVLGATSGVTGTIGQSTHNKGWKTASLVTGIAGSIVDAAAIAKNLSNATDVKNIRYTNDEETSVTSEHIGMFQSSDRRFAFRRDCVHQSVGEVTGIDTDTLTRFTGVRPEQQFYNEADLFTKLGLTRTQSEYTDIRQLRGFIRDLPDGQVRFLSLRVDNNRFTHMVYAKNGFLEDAQAGLTINARSDGFTETFEDFYRNPETRRTYNQFAVFGLTEMSPGRIDRMISRRARAESNPY